MIAGLVGRAKRFVRFTRAREPDAAKLIEIPGEGSKRTVFVLGVNASAADFDAVGDHSIANSGIPHGSLSPIPTQGGGVLAQRRPALAESITRATSSVVTQHRDRIMVFNLTPLQGLLEELLSPYGTVVPLTTTSLESIDALASLGAMMNHFMSTHKDNVALIVFCEESRYHPYINYGVLALSSYLMFDGRLGTAEAESCIAEVSNSTKIIPTGRHPVSHAHVLTRFQLLFTIPQFPMQKRLRMHKMVINFHKAVPSLNPNDLVVSIKNNGKRLFQSSELTTWSSPAQMVGTSFALDLSETPVSLLGDCIVTVLQYVMPDDAAPYRRLLFRTFFNTLFVPSLTMKLTRKDMDLEPSAGWDADRAMGFFGDQSWAAAPDPVAPARSTPPPSDTGDGLGADRGDSSDDYDADGTAIANVTRLPEFSATLHFTMEDVLTRDKSDMDDLMRVARLSPMHADLAINNYSALTDTVVASSSGASPKRSSAAERRQNIAKIVADKLTGDIQLALAMRDMQKKCGTRAVVQIDITHARQGTPNHKPSRAASVVPGLKPLPSSRAPSISVRVCDEVSSSGSHHHADPESSPLVPLPTARSLQLPPVVAPPPPLSGSSSRPPLPPPIAPPPPILAPPPKSLPPPPSLSAPSIPLPKALPPPPIGAPPALPPPGSKCAPPPPPLPPPGGKGGLPPPPPPPPPGGKAGGPPPPPPGGLAAAAAAPKYQGPKMKSFFWKKVTGERLRRSALWSSADSALDHQLVDKELMLQLFEVKEVKVEKKSSTADAATDASKKLATSAAVTSQRQQNIGIALKKLKLTANDACVALISCSIDDDRLEAIARLVPTDEETRKLAAERKKGGYAWGAVEEFLHALSTHVPDAPDRVQLLKTTREMNELTRLAEKSVGVLQGAIEQLTNPTAKLALVLRIVLAMGNFMNAGTAHGNAAGFTIENLATLAFLKATDGKTSLLDALVTSVMQKHPSLITWPDELIPVLMQARELQLQTIAGYVTQVSQAVNRLRKVAEEGDTPNGRPRVVPPSPEVVDRLAAVVRECYETFTTRVSHLLVAHQALKEETAAMLEYFAEDAQAGEESAVIGHILAFARDFKATHAAILKRMKAAAK